jgi:menaquinone-specific isochorismate synthase
VNSDQHPAFPPLKPEDFREAADRYGRLVSYSQSCSGVDLLDFLRQTKGQERFYWESGRDDVAFAAFGVVAELTAWGTDRFKEIQRKATDLFRDAVVINDDNELAGPRLFGGFSFRDDFAPDNTWSVFTPANFILPHYQLVKIGKETWLTINAQFPHDENIDEIILALKDALNARYETLMDSQQSHGELKSHTPVDVNYPMPYDAWDEIISNVTQHIHETELEKVVLSRICEIQFNERVDVDSALAFLNEHYPECYRFLFEPRPYHAFYGATPELIAKVKDKQVSTMGLAGSIRRGDTPEADDMFTKQLLNDPKERHEHHLVVEALRERLSDITDTLDIPAETGVYKLSNIQHLYTPITGQLKDRSGILPVVELLHPTPALGGKPRDLAMDVITESETAPRGWYAAPIGWIDYQLDGVFSVAIRSAVSQEKRVWMYAGAGIVGDSIPQKEWDETALKFRPMLNALGLEEQIDVRA